MIAEATGDAGLETARERRRAMEVAATAHRQTFGAMPHAVRHGRYEIEVIGACSRCPRTIFQGDGYARRASNGKLICEACVDAMPEGRAA